MKGFVAIEVGDRVIFKHLGLNIVGDIITLNDVESDVIRVNVIDDRIYIVHKENIVYNSTRMIEELCNFH